MLAKERILLANSDLRQISRRVGEMGPPGRWELVVPDTPGEFASGIGEIKRVTREGGVTITPRSKHFSFDGPLTEKHMNGDCKPWLTHALVSPMPLLSLMRSGSGSKGENREDCVANFLGSVFQLEISCTHHSRTIIPRRRSGSTRNGEWLRESWS